MLLAVQPYIQFPDLRSHLPRATEGRTPVYFVGQHVLKHSGYPQNQERLDTMEEARRLCDRRSCPHLTVPKGEVDQDFIVESRVPITAKGIKAQICLYMAYRDQFTEAAREFTTFLCSCTLTDITYQFFDDGEKCERGRYDNVALYLEGGEGKIGLIDLERFSTELRHKTVFLACRDAIRFFPLHFEEILEVGRNLNASEVASHIEELEEVRTEVLKRFHIIYTVHLQFLRTHNITPTNPWEMIPISQNRKNELMVALVNFAREEYKIQLMRQNCCTQEEHVLNVCPDEISEDAIVHFQVKLPEILDLMINFIPELQKRTVAETIACNREILLTETFVSTLPFALPIIKEYSRVAEIHPKDVNALVSSELQLLSFRSLEFNMTSFLDRMLVQSLVRNLDMFKLEDGKDLAQSMIKFFYTELARGGEIAYHNPLAGKAGRQWLFF